MNQTENFAMIINNHAIKKSQLLAQEIKEQVYYDYEDNLILL